MQLATAPTKQDGDAHDGQLRHAHGLPAAVLLERRKFRRWLLARKQSGRQRRLLATELRDLLNWQCERTRLACACWLALTTKSWTWCEAATV